MCSADHFQNPPLFLFFHFLAIQDLGTLGGSSSAAYGINDSGQVVGFSRTASGPHHAFLWTTDGGMQDLGTLGGSNSYAYGINDSGQVVGFSYTASGDYHAFLWTADGGMQDIGTLGGSNSDAYGINDSGQIVGFSRTASGQGRACMWIPATPETMLAGMALFIMDEVDAGNIDTELEGSLLAKVDAALAALDRGNPNDAKVVMNDLKALINQIEAEADGVLEDGRAADDVGHVHGDQHDLIGVGG